MNIPRVVIAGIYADCGKTTIATGLMRAFMKKGLDVQPFKEGPDYIDASYHTAVTKKASRHLDPWITSPQAVLEIFEKASRDADVAVIEGAMGLFDGIPRTINGLDDYESTAQIARILKAPVILVVDVYGMRMHAGTVVQGFKSFDRRVKINGVILNNFKSQQLADWMKRIIESGAKVPVIGAVPYNPEISLPSRPGGLIPVPERETLKETLSKLVEHVREHVDVDKALEMAEGVEELPDIENKLYPSELIQPRIRVGVTQDEAFNFLYEDNIDLLRSYGAEMVFFSPIHDKKIPSNIDGLYIPGGFPDMLADRLAANQTMRQSIKKAAEDEMPMYSEHGGTMYLTESITNFEGSTFPMVGALPARASMEKKLQAIDSTLMYTIENNMLSQKGATIHGHEFHFSRIIDVPTDARFAYEMQIGKGVDGKHDGWMEHNILALLGHLHFGFNAKFAQNLVKSCEHYHNK